MPNENFIVSMKRDQLQGINACSHAGLLLDRGFSEWAKNADRSHIQHNEAAHNLHKQASSIAIPSLYKKAYKNWQKQQVKNSNNSQIWIGKLENRMYLGMGEASPLEAGITLHHTYGVPYIPGSAIKGILHHYAKEELGLDIKELKILFGEEASATDREHSGSAGYIIFNDAWWIPEGKALSPEMITVHAPKYYSSKGTDAPHPDFESPNPNPQIAIQGSFLFSIEGEGNWAKYAIKLLSQCLGSKGVGGKTASGYGYFYNEEEKEAREKEDKAKKEIANAEIKEGVYLKKNMRNQSFYIEKGAERDIALATSSRQKEVINTSLNETQQNHLNQNKGIKIDALINGKNLVGIKKFWT